MLTFQQRRDTILSQFAQAKADLETLNSDIDAEIEKNKSVISTLTSKNTELASLKSNNEGSIKTFAKFLFSSLCKSSRVRCIRSTTVDTTKSLFVHVKCLYCRGKRISGEIGRRLVSVVKMHE